MNTQSNDYAIVFDEIIQKWVVFYNEDTPQDFDEEGYPCEIGMISIVVFEGDTEDVVKKYLQRVKSNN